MHIEYSASRDFNSEELRELFLSVQWQSGKYPDKLVIAMRNSGAVFSAWKNGRLVGLINALDDGIMTAYVHYLLVNPEYHGNGIGKELLRRIKEKYANYPRIVLISDNRQIAFYKNSGFVADADSTPMFLDSF